MPYFIHMEIFGLSILLLCFLVTFQLLFVGFFLITHPKGKKQANVILGIIFLLFSWNMADLTLQISPFQVNLGLFNSIDDTFFTVFGPLFFTYAKLVIYKNYKIGRSFWIHLLPYFVSTITFLFINTYGGTPGSLWVRYALSTGMYLHFLVYLALGYRLILNYRSIIKDQFSKVDDINLNWLSNTLKMMAVLVIISFSHNFIFFSGNEYVYGISFMILLAFIFYFVNSVILKALRQPEIFAGIEQITTKKYVGSNLTGEEAERYRRHLVEILETEKHYLNPKITIQDLAEKLGTSSKVISQVINQSFDKNFFDFINSYRIRDAQDILKHSTDKKLTILEVMYQVGFNSKSSFNAAFKKVTGQTPSAFRRSF